jgi:hypothetical protein
MTSPDGKLIDGNVPNLVQLPSLQPQSQVSFEDSLDHVPADAKEAGDMLDRSNTTQIDHEPIEALQSSPFAFSEVDGFLQSPATTSTLLKMAVKDDELFASSHRERMEFPSECSVHDQVEPSGTTMSALPFLFLPADVVINSALPVLCPFKLVAFQCQCVVQIACRRHGQFPFVSLLGNKHETYCSGGDFSIPDFVGASSTGYSRAHSRRASSSGPHHMPGYISSRHLPDEPYF